MFLSLNKTGMVCLLAVVNPAAALSADGAAMFTGTIVRLTGHARHRLDEAGWQETQMGDVFGLGSVFVQTEYSRESMTEVMLNRKAENLGPIPKAGFCTLRMFSNSILRIGDCAIKRIGTNELTQTDVDLQSGNLVLVALHHSSGCEAKLDKARFSRLSLSSSPSPEAGETVFIFRPAGEILILSGSIRVVMAAFEARTLKDGDRLTIATGEITQLPANAPERKLWP